MNMNPRKFLPILVFFAMCGFVGSASLRADALTDIQISVVNGKLTTGLTKYAGTFDPETFETHDPGFAGIPPSGHQYAVRIAQRLWYHSGVEGDPVTAVPTGAYVQVSDGNATLNVTGSSGLQAGLILDNNLSGSLHSHLDFLLFPHSGWTAPDGVYGIVMQITSPSYQTSDPFLLAIANIAGGGLTLEGIEYGEQAIFNAAVPEPSSIALAGLGVAGLAGAALRRRMRKQKQ